MSKTTLSTKDVRRRLREEKPTEAELRALVMDLCGVVDEERAELWRAEERLAGRSPEH